MAAANVSGICDGVGFREWDFVSGISQREWDFASGILLLSILL